MGPVLNVNHCVPHPGQEPARSYGLCRKLSSTCPLPSPPCLQNAEGYMCAYEEGQGKCHTECPWYCCEVDVAGDVGMSLREKPDPMEPSIERMDGPAMRCMGISLLFHC